MLAPSSRNCIPMTPTLSVELEEVASEAVAETVIVPRTVAPFDGLVIAAVGLPVSKVKEGVKLGS